MAINQPFKPTIWVKILLWTKKNWVIVIGLVFILATYWGLQYLKNSIQQTEGTIMEFHRPDVPDFSEENQSNENAQNKNDRVGTIQQNIEQTDKDSTPVYTRYSQNQVYNQKDIQPIATVPVIGKQSIIQTEMKPIRPIQRTALKPKTVIQNSIKEQKIVEAESFHTVILTSVNENEKPTSNQLKPSKGYIKAAVYGNQIVRSGSQVRVRILESFSLNETEVPMNSICNGIALLSSNRVTIVLTSVQVHGQQIAFKRIVCDKDLLPGIAFNSEDALQQNLRLQRNNAIDQTTNQISQNLPTMNSTAGAIVATGTGIVNGISNAIRYGGIQKRLGEISLEDGYKVFIQ